MPYFRNRLPNLQLYSILIWILILSLFMFVSPGICVCRHKEDARKSRALVADVSWVGCCQWYLVVHSSKYFYSIPTVITSVTAWNSIFHMFHIGVGVNRGISLFIAVSISIQYQLLLPRLQDEILYFIYFIFGWVLIGVSRYS